MRHLLFLALITVFMGTGQNASALSSIFCGADINGFPHCGTVTHQPSESDAVTNGMAVCQQMSLSNCSYAGTTITFSNQCRSVAAPLSGPTWYSSSASSAQAAQDDAISYCEQNIQHTVCTAIKTLCDETSGPLPTETYFSLPIRPSPPNSKTIADYDYVQLLQPTGFLNIAAIRTGISFGLGLIFALLVYAKRAWITNFIIHGNLPRTLPIYAGDIEVLFKRSQRVNWYGRVVFGITARLGMTEAQLALIRRYWLGRVIAFDSLRRQRQSELARMHLQLAASAKSEPKDKTALSQLLAAIKTILLSVFYLLRALFSFLFGFLFLRVTIAQLARGKLIESDDLVLLLQAKEAIELSATYLKEYLTTAETFDGREELFEPK
jgi:hypothetical protein